MDAVGHFGCRKFTLVHIFLVILDQYRFFFLKFLTKWLPSVNLDVRNSLSIVFLAISDRSAILDFLNLLLIAILAILDKMAAGGHFGCPKITFDHSSCHFATFCFLNFWTKWPPAAILDWTTMSVIELLRDIWMNNTCVRFEERSLNPSNV